MNFNRGNVSFLALLFIFLLAILVRASYLQQMNDTMLFHLPIADSGDFHHAAKSIATSGLTKDQLQIGRIPFYRLLLASVYKVSNSNIYLACLIQSLLGAFACCLVYYLGITVFNHTVGIISGIIMSLYWPLIAFGAKTLPVNLAVFFSLCAIASIYKFLANKNILWLIISGISFMFATLTRPSILFIVPVMLIWLSFNFRKKDKGLYATIFILTFLLTLSIAIIMDYTVRKEVMPIHARSGLGLYQGADFTYMNIRPGSEWKKLMMELLKKDLTTTSERNVYWYKKFMKFVIENPSQYIVHLKKKLYITLNTYEFSPNECLNFFRKQSKFLSLPFFNFGIIAAFSIIGIVLSWKEYRQAALPLYLFIFVYLISLLFFIPMSRYRLPVSPFLSIFAAYCIMRLLEHIYQRKWRSVVIILSFLVPLLILTNTNFLYAEFDSFSRPHYHTGIMYLEYNNAPKKALKALNLALAKQPDDADIYEAMGDAYIKLGDLKNAEANYKMSLSIEDESPWVMNKVGVVYAKMGRIKEAEAVFKKVLARFPIELVSTHINLGNCYTHYGELLKAEKEYERAIYLAPENPQAVAGLARLYEKKGDAIIAKQTWERYNELLARIRFKLR